MGSNTMTAAPPKEVPARNHGNKSRATPLPYQEVNGWKVKKSSPDERA